MREESNRNRLITIIIGAAVFLCGILYKPSDDRITAAVFAASLLISGGSIMLNAARNIIRGDFFDENFLMSIASVGAFFIGEYPEGVAVMLFYQVGELFQSYAIDRSRKSIAGLMDIRPDYANVRRGDTYETDKVDPESVNIGDIILIKAGERVPLDAEVIEGSSTLDMSKLTGESLPREAGIGDTILSGSINQGGLLSARVIKEFGESTVSRILDLVENAAQHKASSEDFITRFARYYTPAVVFAAVLLAALPPLILKENSNIWLYRALTFLVISCPCALVVSIPMSFFGGIGGASRSGVLIKGGNYLEALAKTETVVFDKTGTLTKGAFRVREIVPQDISKEELLKITAYAENYSTHPISVSLKQEYGKEIDSSNIKGVEEYPGCGVVTHIDGRAVAAGNSKLMERLGIPCPETGDITGTAVHTAIDNVYKGFIIIADEVREDAAKAVSSLRDIGITRTVMLTGDTWQIAEKVGSQLGINEVYAELLPAEKVLRVEELIKSRSSKSRLVFIGDGINDAPVLMRADIGVAMGGLGSDAAIEAADAVIMTDEPSKLTAAVLTARKTLRIVKQNIVFALTLKAVILLLGAFGIASMWAAVFADVGVASLAILNALRALSKPRLL